MDELISESGREIAISALIALTDAGGDTGAACDTLRSAQADASDDPLEHDLLGEAIELLNDYASVRAAVDAAQPLAPLRVVNEDGPPPEGGRARDLR